MRPRNVSHVLGALAATAALALVLIAQDAQRLKLGVPVLTVVFPRLQGTLRFDYGFHPETHFDTAQARLYDSGGKNAITAGIIVPGADSVQVNDAAASRTGMLAVVVEARRAENNEPGATPLFKKPAAAPVFDSGDILLFDKSGPPSLVIRTNPFLGISIAIDPDGYIWIAGTDPRLAFWKGRDPEPAEARELCVLQKYSVDGVLVGNYLKRSSFGPKVYPWLNTNRAMSALRASAAGVGLFVPHEDGSGEWVEHTLSGELKGRWPVAAPAEKVRMVSLGFTDSGSVYAEWDTNDHPLGRGVYRLNKAMRRWDQLDDPRIKPPAGRQMERAQFWGTDGNSIILRIGWTPNYMAWFDDPPR